MKTRKLSRLLIALVFASLGNPQSTILPPEVLLLSKIRRQAKADFTSLPNFTCLETIQRSTRNHPWKRFSAEDVVLVEVAHVGNRELFAWPGAARFENPDLGPMIGSGLVSNGEFVGHARSVFLGDYGVIRYNAAEAARGRPAARYDYDIAASFSGYTVHNAGRQAMARVKGSFWADPTTFDLIRLTADPVDLPVELGIRNISTSVDYSRVKIGASSYLLPEAATVIVLLSTGLEQRNHTEFTHCRQYSTESVLSFDDPDMERIRSRSTAPGRAVEIVLPADVIVTVDLETPIQLDQARAGDAISASLDSELRHKGQVIAPKGAQITGRVRLVQREKSGYTVGLEFTDLTSEDRHARFLAKLLSVDSRYALSDATPEPAGGSGFRLELPMVLAGVATFFVPDRIHELPKGLRMQWRTIAATR